ncbi:MAG: hypothetical protein EOP53_03735 [Sphingobacteriales bacterium]|nr:MAG: hypothetical protein EOP53_03735 [Sphingobacteriales bacterium]
MQHGGIQKSRGFWFLENSIIKVEKGFIGRKTNTTYKITKAGEKAFKDHINALEKMIKATK